MKTEKTDLSSQLAQLTQDSQSEIANLKKSFELELSACQKERDEYK